MKPIDNLKRAGIIIEPVQDIVYHHSFGIYGRAGSGKTTFGSTFPKPILLIDMLDKGTDSVRDVEDLHVARLHNFDQVEELYYFLKKNLKYKSIILDTVTMMQQFVIQKIAPPPPGKRAGDWGTVTKRQWGQITGIMKDWIINYRDLPAEVAFLAQERLRREDDEDDTHYDPEAGPSVSPSVAGVLNAAVTVIGNAYIRRKIKEVKQGRKVIRKEVRYVHSMRLGADPVYITKLRKPKSLVVPTYLDDPTYDDVIDILTGGEK